MMAPFSFADVAFVGMQKTGGNGMTYRYSCGNFAYTDQQGRVWTPITNGNDYNYNALGLTPVPPGVDKTEDDALYYTGSQAEVAFTVNNILAGGYFMRAHVMEGFRTTAGQRLMRIVDGNDLTRILVPEFDPFTLANGKNVAAQIQGTVPLIVPASGTALIKMQRTGTADGPAMAAFELISV